MIGRLAGMWDVLRIYLGIPRILRVEDQGEGGRERGRNRTCKRRRGGAIRRRRNKCLWKCSEPATVAARIRRTIIQCLLLEWGCGKPSGVAEPNTEQTHLHVTVVDGSKSGFIEQLTSITHNDGSPVPQQEGEWCDEDEVPWRQVRTIMGEWGRLRAAHPMLEPRSLPLSLAPTAKFMMQATMLRSNVAPRTNHSWKRRVIKGRDASGISSAIEW